MLDYNRDFGFLGLNVKEADAFINGRLDDIRAFLQDLENMRSFGFMRPGDYLPMTREFHALWTSPTAARNSRVIGR